MVTINDRMLNGNRLMAMPVRNVVIAVRFSASSRVAF